MCLSNEWSATSRFNRLFFFQLPQPQKFAHPQVDVLLLPGVEDLLGHTILPAQIANRGNGLSLPKSVDDWLFGER